MQKRKLSLAVNRTMTPYQSMRLSLRTICCINLDFRGQFLTKQKDEIRKTKRHLCLLDFFSQVLCIKKQFLYLNTIIIKSKRDAARNNFKQWAQFCCSKQGVMRMFCATGRDDAFHISVKWYFNTALQFYFGVLSSV